MASKIDIVNDAYSQMRISGLTVQPTPEDVEVAIQRLENMMYELESRNICLGYNFEEVINPNSRAGVVPAWNQMMATNLAVRLIPDFNKNVPPTLLQQATQSLSNASARSAAAEMRQVQYPARMARGAGNTLRFNRWRRFFRPQYLPPVGCETQKMVVGDIDDFKESFRAYLDGETISTYEIAVSAGLQLLFNSSDGEVISYRVEALSATSGNSQFAEIQITTDTGRIETRTIAFLIGETIQDLT